MTGALAGKVALVTGTGRGIGRIAARRFAAEGARVFGGDLDADAARAFLDDAPGLAGRADAARVDVTDEDAVAEWAAAATARFGRVDILYNNAGAVRFGSLASQPYADWRFTLAAELDSVFLVTRAVWPHLVDSGGSVVNVGSVVAAAGSVRVGRVAHTASKGGVVALTRQLAAEGSPFGIRVNSVSPGLIVTEGTKETLLRPDDPMAAGASAVPLGRLGTPDDVVDAALFLASDAASYITGVDLRVDGGWSAVLPTPSAS